MMEYRNLALEETKKLIAWGNRMTQLIADDRASFDDPKANEKNVLPSLEDIDSIFENYRFVIKSYYVELELKNSNSNNAKLLSTVAELENRVMTYEDTIAELHAKIAELEGKPQPQQIKQA